MFYLKQMSLKNSTGNKITDYWTSWLKGLKMVVLLLLSLSRLYKIKYATFIDLHCTRSFAHTIYIQSFGLYFVYDWLGWVYTLINSQKNLFNSMINTTAFEVGGLHSSTLSWFRGIQVCSYSLLLRVQRRIAWVFASNTRYSAL